MLHGQDQYKSFIVIVFLSVGHPAIPMCEEMNKYTKNFFKELTEGLK